MNSSIQTKKCKYCKAEIDSGARRCPKCQGDLRNWFLRHKILSIIGILFILFVVIGSIGYKTREPERLPLGSTGFLRHNGEDVWVAKSKLAYEKFVQALLVKDTIGQDNVIATGEILRAKYGTKVLIIDISVSDSDIDYLIPARKVRILEGELLGESVWVPRDYISDY